MAKALSAAAAGLASVVASRRLGPSGQGTLVLVVTLAGLVMLLTSMGSNLVARRLLIDPFEPLVLAEYLGLVALLILLQVFAVGLLTECLLPIVHIRASVQMVLTNGLFAGSMLGALLTLDALNAYGYLRRSAVIDAAGSLAQLGGIYGLVLLDRVSIVNIVAVYFGCLSLEVTAAIVSLQLSGRRPGLAFRSDSWRRLVGRGLFATGANVAQTGAYRLDRYILGSLRSPASVGVYSIAATGSETLRLISFALGQVLFFRVASGTIQHKVLNRYRLLLVSVTAVMSIAIIVTAPSLVMVVLGPQYGAATQPLRILAVAEVATASFFFDAVVLEGRGKLGQTAVAAIFGLIVVTLGDFLLIPHWGAVGAAYASLVGYVGMAAVARVFVRKLDQNGHLSR